MIRLDLYGLQEARAAYRQFGVEIDDYEELWSDVADVMVEHVAETFETEGFGVWPELAPSTVAVKRRGGYPLDPLIRGEEGHTEHLLESLLDPTKAARFEQGRSSLGTFTSKSMSWGTDVSYAEVHQEGDGVPMRQPLMITPQLLERVQEVGEDHARRTAREAGLDVKEGS